MAGRARRAPRTASPACWIPSKSTVHHQIGVTPNRTGEMQVICLGQPIMAERLRRVTGAFQTFKQTDLERLLFRFSTDCRQQSLQLCTMSQIANLVIKAKHEFAILCQFFWVWIFVDAIDGRNRALFQLARDSLVCGQHEFFDQLVRYIILDTLQFYRVSLFINADFYLRKIEVQGAMLESPLPQ